MHRLSLLEILAASIIGFFIGLAIAWTPATLANDLTAEMGVIRSWNKAFSTLETENTNLQELSDSYERNPPGKVLLTPDVRAAQKKRRLELIDAVINSHDERIPHLRNLRQFEEASQ